MLRIFLLCTLIIVFGNASDLQVNVEQGTLQGKLLYTEQGFGYSSFTAIPYAKPPVGNLRFREPVPAEGWEGILDATVDANVCAQYERLFKKVYIGSEDCLYLNVYVPNSVDVNQNLPVMFWVHGGAFINGNGNAHEFGPDYLVEHNVIVVTINYRLGPLGFLSLDNTDAPGNVGLKDQVLALKWVNENIHEFGGDANQVTIFGQSAGGASVNFLILSPLTKGLYSRAIMESGTSQNEWAIQDDNVNKAFKLGAILGVTTDDKDVLINYLLNVPTQQLVLASYSTLLSSNALLPTFVPTVETNVSLVSAFLAVDPRTAITASDLQNIPLMIGSTSQEGYMGFLTMATLIYQAMTEGVTLSTLIPSFETYVPAHIKSRLSSDATDIICQMIKEHYFPTEDNLLGDLLDLLTDAAFLKDIDYTAKMFSEKTTTYYYRFSFKGTLNMFNLIYPWSYNEATHGDELAYIFNPDFEEIAGVEKPAVTEREELTIRRMTEMWTNFAKFGDPTPSLSEAVNIIWEPISENKVNCLSIDDELTILDDPYAERLALWNNLETYY